jgi:hypothetical protein
MDTPKKRKRGRPKKESVSKKTAQKRDQRERATMSQSVKQSVVVKIGDTKRKSTTRKKSGSGMPSSYQHNLQPTIVQSPQVDYTPLILALNRTPNPIQPPMPTIRERTPLSVGVQTAEQELANNSKLVPIELEMNKRPRSSFVSNSELDRRVQAEADEPRAEIDYGFGNQQFFPKPRSESVVSDLTESSSGFTPLTTPRFTPKAPRKAEILTSDEGSSLDPSTISSQPVSSVSGSSYGITRLHSFLPVQEQPVSAQGSLEESSLASSSVSSMSLASSSVSSRKSSAKGAEEGSVSTKASSVSTRKSSAKGAEETSVSSRQSSAKGAEQTSVSSSKKTKLGRPVLYSGSSVGSRVEPKITPTLTSAQKQEAEIQALKKTFANYKKKDQLFKLKGSEINTLLVRKGNKSRIDTLARKGFIGQKDFDDYYARFNYVSKPEGLF